MQLYRPHYPNIKYFWWYQSGLARLTTPQQCGYHKINLAATLKQYCANTLVTGHTLDLTTQRTVKHFTTPKQRNLDHPI
jgi:uncharacterized membrane protein